MNEVDPILLLMAGLVVIALAIAWGLGIFVAVRLARRRRRSARRWVLLAILAGPILLGIGRLAHNCRRSVAAWVVAQLVCLAGACVAAYLATSAGAARPARPGILGISPILDLAVLMGWALAALGPLVVLAFLGPRRAPPPDGGEDKTLIRAVKLHKTYRLGKRNLHVLRGVSLSVKRGEFVAILGASGSGKSTLLHLLGLLDAADGGHIELDGTDSQDLTAPQRDRIRCRDIGFVFQFYHLLPELTVLENTLLPVKTSVGPVRWQGVRRQVRERAVEILQRVGLGERLGHRPKELSGGEQQRVAIARALVNSPKILLADEPTGNLDSRTGQHILDLLKELNQQARQTIVMVTHNYALAQAADRLLNLRDGKLK